MSGRRNRPGLSPTLFPFLAVLVCTLGTLILFLAIVAQESKESAEAEAQQLAREYEEKEATTLTASDAVELIEDARLHATTLVGVRDQQTSDLEQQRDRLTAIEDHVRRLRVKLKRLSDEVDVATAGQVTDAPDADAIVLLKQTIESETEKMEVLRKEAANAKPRVVIVPHKGPNGTDRRPVYLECTADGLTIFPEGTKISRALLQDSATNANPLDAALRVVRHHALQVYGDAIPPYPLLVVRPDGVQTYSDARGAMKDWDDQFGYELVPADVELAFNQPDQLLKGKVEVAVREAALRQRAARLAAGSGYGRGGGGQFGGGQQGGGNRRYGSDRSGGTSGSSPYRSGSGSGSGGRQSRAVRTLSAKDLEHESRAGGYRSPSQRGSLSEFANSSLPTDLRRNPSSSASISGEFDDRGQQSSATGDYAANGSYNPAGAVSGSPERNPQANPYATGGTRLATSNQYASPRNSTDPQSGALPSLSNSGTNGSGSGPQNLANAGTPGQQQTGAAQGQPGVMQNQDATLGQPGGPSQQFAEQDSGSENAPSNASTNQVAQNQVTENRYAGESLNQGTSQSRSQQTAQSSPRQSGSSPGGASGMPSRASQASSASTGSSLSHQQSNQAVQRQGRDWALPPEFAGARGTAVVRTIRAQCSYDNIVLLGAKAGSPDQVFTIRDGNVNRTVLELAGAVRQRIGQWGASLPGGRWVPILEVTVAPFGEARFSELRMLMSGSGVEVRQSRASGRTAR